MGHCEVRYMVALEYGTRPHSEIRVRIFVVLRICGVIVLGFYELKFLLYIVCVSLPVRHKFLNHLGPKRLWFGTISSKTNTTCACRD